MFMQIDILVLSIRKNKICLKMEQIKPNNFFQILLNHVKFQRLAAFFSVQ